MQKQLEIGGGLRNFHMGIAYMNEGKLDSAVMLMKLALSTFSDLNDQSGSGRTMKFLGDTYEKWEFRFVRNYTIEIDSLKRDE